MPSVPKGFKTLFLDIEASDLAADIGHVLSIGYKWAHEAKSKVISLLDYPGSKPNDDSKLVEAFRPTFEAADIVVHHFGDFYDIPFLQTRLLVHKKKPLPRVTTVDTWRIAKKRLKFGSNRLARILEVLGCPYEKSPVKLSVWADARCGDRKAMKYVIDHNRLDVLVTEWVYNHCKSVWDQHPRVFVEKSERTCPVCGEESGEGKGIRVCATKQYRRMVCTSCGFNWKGKLV